MKPRERYQNGSIRREARKHGAAVWTLRWREMNADGSSTRRKAVIGTVEQFRTKAAALKACEFLRSTINREGRTPRTVAELTDHYTEHELPNKTPYTREVYAGYLAKWITPKWGTFALTDVRTVAVESWLGTLKLSNGSRGKVRNIMSALYAHAMRWEFFDRNPITMVRQSAKRTRTPDVLTADELKALLAELTDPWRTAVYVAVTTGLRVSELLALKWSDVDLDAGEIRLSRGIVRQHIGEMKTEASRKPVPLDAGLADILVSWRGRCPYNQDTDYIFASPDKNGQQPYWPTAGMEKHIRPAALRAKITKRIGWHTLRHTFGTLLKANGADVATVQALMRHANASVTMDRYVQAVTPAKRQAQRNIVGLLDPCGPTMLESNTASC
jgi:integrase